MQGQIDWHVSGGIRRIDHPYVEAKWIYGSIEQTLPTCSCAPARDEFLCRHMFWHARWDPTIVMATYNNSNILMVLYEDLLDEDKDVISKAIEKFQN